ncbi:hypothetical protein CHS0354_010712 [Potamilus streckersoni]|uniref:C-type lectin domain-containing protein n=1 Tax=Potamilus streckersoni TaxID=2493646 RepID=A0AAE0W0P4_9BIVA|nr:hypothetical protein CHS0354_010712 [Potamilus streckersoni]
MGVCEAEGAKLALYNNEQELSDLLSLFNNTGALAWIGITDLIKEGEWKFWNGKTPTILRWAENEPNGGVNEDCAAMNSSSPSIMDYPCATELWFICQRYLP